MTLGEYIKKLRNEKDISCEDLSKEAGIDLKMLQDLENDATDKRDYNTIYSLTKYFNIKASSFVNIDALNIDFENTNSIVFSIIETAEYPSLDKKKHNKNPSYLPWKKDCARFIIAATQYKIYIKATKSATLESLINIVDKAYSTDVHKEANICSYSPTGTPTFGVRTIHFEKISLFKENITGITSVHIHYKNIVILLKNPTISVKRNKSKTSNGTTTNGINTSSPLFQVYLQKEKDKNKTAAFGGGEYEKSTGYPEKIASIDADIKNDDDENDEE